MRVLFDHNLPRLLKAALPTHEVALTELLGWKDLGNGRLLSTAQETFDVLLTTDTNLYHQQNVAQFNIAVVVLRAYKNDYRSLHPLIHEVRILLPTVEPGKVYYLYADEKLRESDQRKGKGPGDSSSENPTYNPLQ